MAELQINCPITAKPIGTGIDLDPNAFKGVRLSGNSVGCPHCGKMHTWAKSDVINPPR